MAINQNIQNLISINRKLSSTDADNMFYYFYGRKATNPEIKHWTKKTSKELFNALEPNAKQFKTAGYYKDVLTQSTSAPATAPTPTPTRQATLTSPNGRYKTVVNVGSTEAGQLQNKGWTLSDTGKEIIDVTKAVGIAPIEPTPTEPTHKEAIATEEMTDKQFYRKGDDIFEAGTDRHIGPAEWKKDWSGKATEITSPIKSPTATEELERGVYDPSKMEWRSRMPVMDIPFKEGLNKDQKSSIYQLAEKPIDQWNQTDKDNWEYATGNTDYGQRINITPKEGVVIDSKGEPTAPTEPTEPTAYDPFTEAAKYGYNREDFTNDPGFFDYWKNKTPEELKNALIRRGDFDAATNTKKKDIDQVADEGLTDDQKADMQEGHNWIDEMIKNGELNESQAAVLHEIYAGEYTSGQRIPSIEELKNIISDAATNAETDLSPYYERITGRELADLKQDMANIRGEAERYTAREAVDYSQKLAQTKQNLRTRGMTFSGISRQKLGAEGALEARGVQGELPTTRQAGWEEQEAGYLQRSRELGLESERALGTEAIKKIDFGKITTPYRTTPLYTRPIDSPHEPGDIRLEKKRELEKSKWDRVSAYRPYI